jgi:hypothetical protein
VALLFALTSCDSTAPSLPGQLDQAEGVVLFVCSATDNQSPSFIASSRLDGSGFRRLTFPDEVLDTLDGQVRYRGIPWQPRWQPQGRLICYEEFTDPGFADVVIMNSDGSHKRTVTSTLGYAVGPSWSPDGGRILYHHHLSYFDEAAVAIIDTLGTVLFRLAPGMQVFEGDTVYFYPASATWGPVADELYMIGSIGHLPWEPGAVPEVFSYDLGAGTLVRRLTRNGISEGGFFPSADGRKLLFMRGAEGTDEQVCVMALEDSAYRAGTPGPSDGDAVWSTNGDYICFIRRNVPGTTPDGAGSGYSVALVRLDRPGEVISVPGAFGDTPALWLAPGK